MNGEEIIKYCLEKRGAYLDFPFGEGYATVKIKTSLKHNGYVFAEIFELNGEERFTFSTSAADAEFLRESLDGAVVRGGHCPPVQAKYKSTATVSGIGDDLLKQFADVYQTRTSAVAYRYCLRLAKPIRLSPRDRGALVGCRPRGGSISRLSLIVTVYA